MRIASVVAVLILMSSPLIAGVNRWTPAELGPTARVYDLAADHSNSDVAYAHTQAGIYKTADGGLSWRAVNDGLSEPAAVQSLIVTDDALFVAIGNNVFASWDGAEHWQRRGSLGSVFVSILAFDPRASTLLAATTGGLSYSQDAGATWVNPQMQPLGQASSLVVSSNVALMQFDSDAGGLHGTIRSTDGGRTWKTSQRSADFLYANPSLASVYGATGTSVSVSEDGGETWRKLAPLPVNQISELVPVASGVYAATDRGVYLFNQAAQQWSIISPAVAVGRLAIGGSTARRLFAAPSNGVITVAEGQSDWKSANSGLPTAAAVDIAISTKDPATAYAATSVQLFRTDDSGQSWLALPLAAEGVAISPDSSKVVYARGTNVFKSSDSGATWKSVAPRASSLAIAPSDPATIYATLEDGMAKSADAGVSWSWIMSGLATSYQDFYYGFQASSLAVDPSNASTVYLGRWDGLNKTTDGGASWRDIARSQVLTGLVIDPHDSSTLYAGAFAWGVTKSVDQGLTWTSLGLIDKQIHNVAVDGSRVYADSPDGHIYRSSDGGQRWEGFDEGLGGGGWSRIAVDPRGSLLYAATNAGVYQYEIADEVLEAERMPDTPLQLPDDQHGLLLPAAGSAAGAGGTSFTTNVTLTNTRETAQQLLVSWLPQAGGAETPASFRLTIPSGVTTVSDISARFGISGIGSLAFLPIDADGNADANASIDASARIWAQLPDGLAPSSQSVAAARGAALSDHAELVVAHLRHDSVFRTNLGIVNLSSETHQFTIQINGARASNQVTVAVPPFSLVQMAVPDADYGDLSLVAMADTATRWLLYASLIDRSNHAAETFIATEVQP